MTSQQRANGPLVSSQKRTQAKRGKKSGKFNNTAYRTLKKIPTRQPSPNKHLGTDAKAKKKEHQPNRLPAVGLIRKAEGSAANTPAPARTCFHFFALLLSYISLSPLPHFFFSLSFDVLCAHVMLHLAACLCQIFIQKARFVFRGQTISLSPPPAGFPFLLSFSSLFFALLFIAFSCRLVIICLYRSRQTLTFKGVHSI